jgi:hypothetical protein
MDDVDLYLSLRPRAKEWMPDIPGVHKLSKTDAQLDLDNILANIATQSTLSTAASLGPSASTALQPPPSSNNGEGDRTSSRKARATQAASSSSKAVKAEGKEATAAAHTDASDTADTHSALPLVHHWPITFLLRLSSSTRPSPFSAVRKRALGHPAELVCRRRSTQKGPPTQPSRALSSPHLHPCHLLTFRLPSPPSVSPPSVCVVVGLCWSPLI